MDILSAVGLAIPAGLNAYIPLLGLAIAQRLDVVSLRAPFDQLGSWWAILLITALLAIEIVADKVPAVDHVNDVLQTVVRPVTGAIVMVAASGQAGENYPLVMVAFGILLAGGVHAVKASARPVVNAATGGLGAPVASTAEDVFAAGSTFVAIVLPALVLAVIGFTLWATWWVYARRRASRE
ncbi:MAG: DUF4126 domain-containing protein [Actinobacteria bacterium]|nr:MAG: DUF4126 domain-containing protein [Actinomycetota bacterium]